MTCGDFKNESTCVVNEACIFDYTGKSSLNQNLNSMVFSREKREGLRNIQYTDRWNYSGQASRQVYLLVEILCLNPFSFLSGF